MVALKVILGFVRKHLATVLAAIAGFAVEWLFVRRKPVQPVSQHQADQSIGALNQKSRDEKQAAEDVPPAVWPTADKNAVIDELKKAGVLK